MYRDNHDILNVCWKKKSWQQTKNPLTYLPNSFFCFFRSYITWENFMNKQTIAHNQFTIYKPWIRYEDVIFGWKTRRTLTVSQIFYVVYFIRVHTTLSTKSHSAILDSDQRTCTTCLINPSSNKTKGFSPWYLPILVVEIHFVRNILTRREQTYWQQFSLLFWYRLLTKQKSLQFFYSFIFFFSLGNRRKWVYRRCKSAIMENFVIVFVLVWLKFVYFWQWS